MSGRMMKYPYTLTAKIGMFPFKHHMSKSWIYKYYAVGVLTTFPIFVWLNDKINSPGNIKKYEDQMAKEAALLHEH
ncbi:uncharacterized protein LOC124343372 [Daphnia pulicaria]|uniref:uncharacterized protein LOC124343372 n=1 Tax=Daphnia pulicaria TaxID=35523 RepID=UPI001EEB5552|nr:uncharacterized protein LOC124343372 [Daphnia pulicaria]